MTYIAPHFSEQYGLQLDNAVFEVEEVVVRRDLSFFAQNGENGSMVNGTVRFRVYANEDAFQNGRQPVDFISKNLDLTALRDNAFSVAAGIAFE